MISSPLSALMATYRADDFLLVGGVIIIVLSGIFVLSSSLLDQSAFATVAGENGKIAFDSPRDGNFEVYTMNSDGSNQQRLTNNPALDGIPSWSPDGTKIVFYREGYIYVMNADGSNQQRLTSLGNENTPSWSPDGRKIVFTSTPEFNNLEIYVMNADGSNQQRLTNNAAYDSHPSWSPDGTKIVFASERDTGNWQIYVMNADGSNQQRLTNNAADDYQPDWSPDGTKIVFITNRHGAVGVNEEIYVMNADGTGQTNLSNNPGQDLSPSWSPDGTKIAFYSLRDGIAQIYVMNAADGSGQTRLADDPGDNSNPDWGTAPNDEVEDTTAPVLRVPEDITAQATTANGGTIVTFTVTAEDNVDGTATLEEDNTITQDDVGGDITMSCDPASGSEFPVGDTTVECTATDEAGNTGTASFTVTVNPPPPPTPTTPRDLIEELISIIQNLEGVPESIKTSLTAALNEVLNIFNDDNPNNDESVCGTLDAFMNQANATEGRGTLTPDQADELRTQAEDIRNQLLDC